ncbi:hypothetical protein OAJ27_00425 [bacterium]|nr:hypothetical protein [bacterium]
MIASTSQLRSFKHAIYACLCACILLFTNGCSNSSNDESSNNNTSLKTFTADDYTIDYYSNWITAEHTLTNLFIFYSPNNSQYFTGFASSTTTKTLSEVTAEKFTQLNKSFLTNTNIATKSITLLNTPAVKISYEPTFSMLLGGAGYEEGYMIVTQNKLFTFGAGSKNPDLSFGDTLMATFKLK